MLWILLACGTPERTVEPEADKSAMRSALTQLQEGGTPENVPPAGQPPDVPEAVSSRRAPTASSDEPSREDPAECKAAKARRERQEQLVLTQRGRSVSLAEDRVNAARAAMASCVKDTECSVDGKRINELMERDASASKAYAAAVEEVGQLEAELYAIDQDIAKACGLPGR
jgi:hypothetical protein